jgi:FtsP/CotA-like multicopper oxidase with cupredoxin domain
VQLLPLLGALVALPAWAVPGSAQQAADSCAWPAPGSAVPEPKDLHSVQGSLKLDLKLHDARQADGSIHYCYTLPDGSQSPTLRLHPGDELLLHLTDGLVDPDALPARGAGAAQATSRVTAVASKSQTDVCSRMVMTSTSTNLHFHGLTIPPRCHQDDVLQTSIQPTDAPFEYRFRIPQDEPPGLYWYHPHIHGFASNQAMGGAAGALIVEGLERAIPAVAGLPERVLVIRDLPLVHPNAPPSTAEPVVPPPILDADGDVTNNNTGYGKPARDLSVNFVAVPYPDYPPATITLKPHQRELWRVLNASSVTYLHLALLYDKVPQPLGVVAIDGVPINRGAPSAHSVKTVDHLVVPPGSRAEFIIEGPPLGVPGLFITRMVNTGQDGENDPNRALASVLADANAPEPSSRLPAFSSPLPPPKRPWLGDVAPVRERKLYFSERRADPRDPNSQILFFITVDGQEPKVFDMHSGMPDIVVKQGDVEDWIIENRSLELHDFHIHQLHFQVREWYGYVLDEPFLRDTVSVPFFDNHMRAYPSVRLRMDFRDPNIVGTFVYHCHMLEHEDGGMMGTIRVEPADPASAPTGSAAAGSAAAGNAAAGNSATDGASRKAVEIATAIGASSAQ